MPKIQLNLSKEEDEIVSIYKVKKRKKDKKEALKEIIREFGKLKRIK